MGKDAPERHTVECNSLLAVPSAADLGSLLRNHERVLLRLPVDVDDTSLRTKADEIQRHLPYATVFASWSPKPGISLLRVVDRSTVLAHAAEFVAAAAEFRRLANALAAQLARKLGVDRLLPGTRIGLRAAQTGFLDDQWSYYFHGFECCFTHRETGQELDVQLDYADDFGALDPWFFHEFLSTTHDYAQLAELLPDAFHDTKRALDLLVEAGALGTTYSELSRTRDAIAPDV